MLDYFSWEWGIAAFFAILLYSKHLFKKFHWSFALAVSYTLLHGILFILYTDLYAPYSQKLNVILTAHYYEAIATILVCVFIMEHTHVRGAWLKWLCVLNICATLILLPVKPNAGWVIGLAVNPSMNASMTAVTLPFLMLFMEKKFWWFMSLAATGVFLIFLSHSSTPVLAFLASLFLPALFVCKRRIWIISFLLVIVCAMAYFIPEFAESNERVVRWQQLFIYWIKNCNIWVGAGNGSFYGLGPVIQYMDDVKVTYFTWMHSDWLQTLFELGIIGAMLWLNAVLFILRGLYLNRELGWIAAAGAWIVVSTLYYPLHFPIHLWLGMMIANVAIKKQECYEGKSA